MLPGDGLKYRLSLSGTKSNPHGEGAAKAARLWTTFRIVGRTMRPETITA